MKVYELLDSPEKWTQDAVARTSDGTRTMAYDPSAVSWCLVGAMQVCFDSSQKRVQAFERLDSKLGVSPSGFINWNNAPERKWEEVVSLCKELDL